MSLLPVVLSGRTRGQTPGWLCSPTNALQEPRGHGTGRARPLRAFRAFPPAGVSSPRGPSERRAYRKVWRRRAVVTHERLRTLPEVSCGIAFL